MRNILLKDVVKFHNIALSWGEENIVLGSRLLVLSPHKVSGICPPEIAAS